MSLKKTINAIRKHKSFLVITHINPDGDALGSQLAVARMLEELGKKVYILAEKDTPPAYKFLPDINKIKTNFRKFKGKFDALIIVDCTEISRIGMLKEVIGGKLKIKIDHHPGGGDKGDIIFKNTSSGATAELVYILFKKLGVKIDKKTATLLYTGIATDTGSFRYSNTTSLTHKIISDLIKLGTEPAYIANRLYESSSLKRLKLLALSLSTLKLYDKGKIASMKITKKMYLETNTSPQDVEEFVAFPRSIEGVYVAILLKQEKRGGRVKVSFRAKGNVDVNKIAGIFNGGGHFQASGCTLEGDIDKIEKKVVTVIKRFIK